MQAAASPNTIGKTQLNIAAAADAMTSHLAMQHTRMQLAHVLQLVVQQGNGALCLHHLLGDFHMFFPHSLTQASLANVQGLRQALLDVHLQLLILGLTDSSHQHAWNLYNIAATCMQSGQRALTIKRFLPAHHQRVRGPFLESISSSYRWRAEAVAAVTPFSDFRNSLN